MTRFLRQECVSPILDSDFDDEAEDMANLVAVLRGDYSRVTIGYGMPRHAPQTPRDGQTN